VTSVEDPIETIDQPEAAPPAPPPPPVADVGAERAGRPARRRRLHGPRWGIVSKLLLMLLVTSIVSCVVVGVVGYVSGRDALRKKAFEQLTFVRNAREAQITREYTRLLDQLMVFTRGDTAIDALRAFEAGFHELESATVDDAHAQALTDYYTNTFVKKLDANYGTTSLPDLFIPKSPAQRYLQAWYTAFFDDDYDKALATADVGDGSEWTKANVHYNGFFAQLVERFQYDDALLIDADGDVVYSAYDAADLGTNLDDGPFRDSVLAKAYHEALSSNSVDFVTSTDLERYQPSYGVPAAWAVSPVGTADKVEGVLALQIPIEAINAVMTGNQGWERDGLGKTGETYLVGDDRLMRSSSRAVLQDPDSYARQAIRGGTDPDVAARAARVKGTILIQPVNTPPVDRALRGETGVMVTHDYFGNEVLAAYSPVSFKNVDWVIVAEIDTSEAFKGIDDFTRRLVLTTAAIIVAVALASLLLAQIFSRPVKKMMLGVRRVAAGDLGAQVPTSSTDEFADLAVAFNDMSRSLQTKQQLLEAEQAEHQRLLLSLMPETVAQRYRQGEETISQEHQDVAVVFADIVGFDDYARDLDATASLAQLNDIVRQFDDAAARLGVERVRTLRSGYLASVGLMQPRVDNTVRALDFARAMDEIVQRFNLTNGTSLGLRAGVDAGHVTSGLVGRSSVIYDMWGEAVNLAYRVQGAGYGAGIYVSQQVYDRLRDTMQFEEAPAIETATGPQPVWRVLP
jgi:class 3 adenylate cyclase